MVSTGQVLAAAVVTGVAVGLTAAAVRWMPAAVAAAALSSFALVVVWRAISNLAGLNGDYVPAISVGDTVCLLAGALGPAVVAFLPSAGRGGRRPPAGAEGAAGRSRWLPALVGGVVGFLIDVIIL
jgi:hypothetical protein